MIYVLGIAFFLIAFLIICTILLQEGKGGGLAAMGGAVTDSVMGAKNPLRRMTVYFFICFIAVILALNYSINQENSGQITPGILPVGAATAPATPSAEPAATALPAATGTAAAAAAAATAKPAGDAPATPAATAPAVPAGAPAAPAATPATPAVPAAPAQ